MDRRYRPSEPLEGRRLLSFGGLDASFGNGGVATAGHAHTRAAAIDVLADGRIVTARVVEEMIGGGPSSLWVSRFLPDGKPDPNFGGTANGQPAGTPRGTVRVNGTRLPREVVDLRVTKQGKIILCGTFDHRAEAVGAEAGEAQAGDLTVVRLNANGTRDLTFGGASRGFNGASPGVAYADFGNTYDRARSLAVDPSGRIAVVGTSRQPTSTSGVAAVFRTDGTFDKTFNEDGKSMWATANRTAAGPRAKGGEAAAFGRDGELLVAGAGKAERVDGPLAGDWAFQTIGPNGRAVETNPFAATEPRAPIDGVVHDTAILADGSVLVAGESNGAMVVAKVLADGTVDRAFGQDGIARAPAPAEPTGAPNAPLGRAGAARIAVLPDGRFYAIAQIAGATPQGAGQQAVYIARYTSGGTADPMFGGFRKVDAGEAVHAADVGVHGDDALVLAAVGPAQPGDRAAAPMKLHKIDGGAAARLSKRGTLEISGTSTGDTITVSRRGKDGRIVARAGTVVHTFPPSRVKRIHVHAQGGNDTVTIGKGVRGTFVDAGPGRDTVTGGDGDDTVVGGIGSDRLVGGNGNDVLSGGGGRDYLLGSAGHDKLTGGAGIDTLNGAGGNDLLFAAGDAAADHVLGGAGVDTVTRDVSDFFKDVENLFAAAAD